MQNPIRTLGQAILINELDGLKREGVKRARRYFYNSILGKPSYSSSSTRKVYSNSLRGMNRYRSVRRAGTRARTSRGYNRGRNSKRRYKTNYRRRTRARRTMGTVGPAFRTRMRRTPYRAELGMRMGFMPSRRYKNIGSTTTVTDKQLHSSRLISVPYNDDDRGMNARNGTLVDVLGVKFRAWIQFKDLPAINLQPIQVRWAILNPKKNTGQTTDVSNGTDFFISDAPTQDTDVTFPASGTCFRYMNRKINTRSYGVLQEGSFLLTQRIEQVGSVGAAGSGMRSKKFISTYIPIKRQMKWANNLVVTDYPEANIHFVWWYVQQGDSGQVKKYNDAPLDYHYESITYFKNAEIIGM